MKKTVLFVLLDAFADWEAAYAMSWLRALGGETYTVHTVSLSREPITSIGGLSVLPDHDVFSAPGNMAGLVLIGGLSWRKENARQVAPLVRKAVDNGGVVGGICDAAAFLGTLGILNNVRHTANDRDDLKQWARDAYTGEALYLRQAAVRDKRIVTANGTAPLEFARELMLEMAVAPEKRVAEWYDFYKRGCYEAPMPVMETVR